MMNQRDQLIEWLSDAHAMERGIIETLQRHADEAKEFPDIQTAIETHLKITKRQVSDLETCLHQLGADSSIIKSSIAKITGMFAGISTIPAKDTIIKNLLAEYSTENFEIACYRSLIAAATALQESAIVQVCEKNLEEEQSMADYLLQILSQMTASYLDQLQLSQTQTL